MEYSGQYLTYAEFEAMGNTIDQVPFNVAETEARLIIDRETFNRFREQERPEELKTCMNKLIKTITWDASYLDANDDEKRRIEDRIIKTYLSNVIVSDERALFRGKECQ